METQPKIKMTCLSCGQANRFPVSKLEAKPKCAKCGFGLVGGDVLAVGLTVHDKATQGDELPIVIDYWAPWCGPCKMMAPEYDKAASALQFNARFAKLDTEKYPAITQRLHIKGIPLLILYQSGSEVARLSGMRPASDIEGFVRQNI